MSDQRQEFASFPPLWRYFVGTIFWYAAGIIGLCLLVQIFAFAGWVYDFPFLYVVLAMVGAACAFLCFVIWSKRIDPRYTTRFGWQYSLLFRHGSSVAIITYLLCLIYLLITIARVIPFSDRNVTPPSNLRSIQFSTTMAMFVASSSLVICSAIRRQMKWGIHFF